MQTSYHALGKAKIGELIEGYYQAFFGSLSEADGPLVMRVVARQGLSRNKLTILYTDIEEAISYLDEKFGKIDLSDTSVQAMLQYSRDRVTFHGSRDC